MQDDKLDLAISKAMAAAQQRAIEMGHLFDQE